MILGVADSDRNTVGFARRRMGLEIACMSDKWFMYLTLLRKDSFARREAAHEGMYIRQIELEK
jgi:hypothetical protein